MGNTIESKQQNAQGHTCENMNTIDIVSVRCQNLYVESNELYW